MSNNKILIVDDHPLVCEWLANVIHLGRRYEVCGKTGSAREALQLVAATKPAIAIVDISLEDGSGLELIKDIKVMDVSVAAIALTMHDEALYAERAMRAGARGYVMKGEATAKVLEAIQTVLEGKLFFSPAVNALMAQKLAQGAAHSSPTPVADLSDRELEVFELLGQGSNTRQISSQLNLSPKTVQVYCSRIKEKLHLTNINELIAQSVRWHERQRPSSPPPGLVG